MASCSVCNTQTPAAKSPTYTSSDMQRVVANGFTPDDATLTRWMTEQSLTHEAALAEWQQRVATASSDWLLCRNCAGRAAPYRQSGTAQKRLPRWAWVLIGAAALIAIVLIINALIPKAQARSLGGFDLDRAAISAIAFSSDGSLLAAGDVDKKIKLFDVKTAKTIRTVSDLGTTVLSLAFSPDGSLLASAGKENVIRLWDVKTGQLLKTLDGHTLAVSDVAFSPDGSLLASSGYDKLINLWDVQTGEVVKTLSGHDDAVTALAFAPDGKRLASASQDQTARLWDVQTGEVLATLSGHAGGLTRIAFAPDGSLIATAGTDRTVKLWEGDTGKIARTLDGYTENIAGLDFSPDSQQLAVLTEHTAQILKMKTWEVLRKFQPREDFTFTDIAFAPDGKTLAIANLLDVSLWDLETSK
jgi:WD40 repeat protein